MALLVKQWLAIVATASVASVLTLAGMPTLAQDAMNYAIHLENTYKAAL